MWVWNAYGIGQVREGESGHDAEMLEAIHAAGQCGDEGERMGASVCA